MNAGFLAILFAAMPIVEPKSLDSEFCPSPTDRANATQVGTKVDSRSDEDHFFDLETMPRTFLIKASIWKDLKRDRKREERFVFASFTLVVAERQRCEFDSGGSIPASEFLHNRPMNFGTKMSAMIFSMDEQIVQLDCEVADAAGVTGKNESLNHTETIRVVSMVRLGEKKTITLEPDGQKLGLTVKISKLGIIPSATSNVLESDSSQVE